MQSLNTNCFDLSNITQLNKYININININIYIYIYIEREREREICTSRWLNHLEFDLYCSIG